MSVVSSLRKSKKGSLILIGILSLGLILIVLLTLRQQIFFSRAATNTLEAESATLAGTVTRQSDLQAAGGSYLQFGGSIITSPTPTPPLPTGNISFQPTTPYYATFFYMWSRNPNTDTGWAYWEGSGNTPPTTWFSHYLPDPNPSAFDPANELYSSNNYEIWKWQVAKMAEAKQEVAIASWWGPDSAREDGAFNNIINSFMGRTDNPYPNLRWAVYYEDEGFGDPATSTIVNDLNYLKGKYIGSPYYLKVSGKPVVFVYGSAADEPGTVLTRWNNANTQLGNQFYIVLKLFSGFTTATPQPNSWHQYAPAVRSGSHAPYSYFVSPGFWLDDGSAVRLPRDLAAFQTAVSSMVNANTTWKLVQTWNEWGEGTSVEPGQQTAISNGREIIDPNGTPFQNRYVDILKNTLPPLEGGTGR